MTSTTRVRVSDESLYGEARTEAGWLKWLKDKFDTVPPEYRSVAILEIDSIGGYEGEHHTEATIYYDRPETDQERQQRRSRALASAAEQEELGKRRLADAQAIRERLAREDQ